ncbi:hypothetical protein A2W40_03860 [Candidatus Giovannonibacteria bacterium RIFCSPHIGHO2_01_45_12]|nr:MAG: hypothetical protein A2120_01830 [Candidatus Giovannonibacteria bacterium GWA2_45_15]OGF58918.1 MAG: hypothetical protein A2W40_03860 [Candidatus Giovannonibacteria bacterium RIFCSPHIGHO2_01_45_12]
MRQLTHDELHALMDGDPHLKEKSDEVHSLPQVSSEEKERGKLQMMEIYAEAINCTRLDTAKDFVKKAFSLIRRGETLDTLCEEYASRKLCHSSLGNNYICFCDEGKERWVSFSGKIVIEDETGVTLEATDGSGAVLKHKKGDYRKDVDGNVEIRIGSYAEFIRYPKGCEIKHRPKG